MKSFFVIVFLFFGLNLHTQAQYSFNTTQTTYQDLVNPTSLNQGAIWDATDIYQIYFNFNFEIYGQNFTALNVYAGGGLHFPGLGNKQLFVFHSPFGGYFLQDKGTSSSLSSIGYEISGVSGQQILKIEWKNAGFPLGYPNGDSTDYANYQIWLFESDSHIEIHFGNNQFDNGTFGQGGPPQTYTLSIKFLFDTCSDMFGLQGPANLPSYWFFNSCVPNYTFIDNNPDPGITYNIYPTTTSIQAIAETDLMVYPNPTSDEIQIADLPESFDLKDVELLDITGRMVLQTSNFITSSNTINGSLKQLTDGVYFLKLTGKNGTTLSKKVLKQGS